MGFNLGRKEYIINSADQSPIEVIDGRIRIKGYGTFLEAQVESRKAVRFSPETFSMLSLDPDIPYWLGGNPATKSGAVSVTITISSSRMTAEWGNNYIINSRPFIFEVWIDSGDGNSELATKLIEAFGQYEAVFGPLPFTYEGMDDDWNAADPVAATKILLKAKESHLAISPDVKYTGREETSSSVDDSVFYVATIGAPMIGDLSGTSIVNVRNGAPNMVKVGDKLKVMTSPVQYVYVTNVFRDASGQQIDQIEVTPTLDGGDTDVVILQRANTGVEPSFDGKYLEENVRMSLPATRDLYGIQTAQGPILKGHYANIQFTVKDDWATGGVDGWYKQHAGLGGTRDEVAGQRNHSFSLYVLEGGAGLWGDGAKLDVLLSTLGFTGDTNPEISELILGNLSGATTISDWVNLSL